MSQIDEAEKFVRSLYREGSTNNENLQLLLWQLKEIVEKLERTDNELGVKGDKLEFLHNFLTKLANLYEPTNSSKFPTEILKLHSAASIQIVDAKNTFVKIQGDLSLFKEKVMINYHLASTDDELLPILNDLESKMLESLHTQLGELMNQGRETIAITEKWLQDCRY